ncbi:hypothetical protein KIL84_007849 [Mauremys mutica]|uniref:Uncharacterized protein n=1 Tax=Mauremys mutica TaxID=74926 RepID=A0A9D4AXC5_9SAUR|nr:hypothetical protein KIL84_007849 [Mauremys mutica]
MTFPLIVSVFLSYSPTSIPSPLPLPFHPSPPKRQSPRCQGGGTKHTTWALSLRGRRLCLGREGKQGHHTPQETRRCTSPPTNACPGPAAWVQGMFLEMPLAEPPAPHHADGHPTGSQVLALTATWGVSSPPSKPPSPQERPPFEIHLPAAATGCL